MSDLYSDRCIEAAMRQRRYAHSLRKLARRHELLFPLPCGVRHVGFQDATTALQDAIRWIHAAKMARLQEQNAIEMQPIREPVNEYRTAAE